MLFRPVSVRSRRRASRALRAVGVGAAVPVAVGFALAAGCGGRDALFSPWGDHPTTLSGGGGAGPDGGRGGTAPDAGQGGTEPDASLPVCRLDAPSSPVVVFAAEDRDLYTPSVALVSAGASSPFSPGRVALQTVSSNASGPSPDGIEVGLLELGAGAWPEILTVTEPFFLLGGDTLTYAEMVVAPGSQPPKLALTWYGDAGMMLGLVTTEPWGTASVSTIVWNDGSTPLGLAAGQGVGPEGYGYDGVGYGLTWEKPGEAGSFVAAVIDDQYGVAVGPHALLGAAQSGGASMPSILWSGQAYVLATGVTDCTVADPLCEPRSVVLSRVRPASGDAWDDSGIDLAGALPAADVTAELGYAALAESAGALAVAWMETLPSPSTNPSWTLRLARLDATGAPLGAAVPVDQGTTLASSLRLAGSNLGFVSVRAEEGDPGLPDTAPGRSRLVVHQLDAELAPLAGPISLPITRFSSYGIVPLVALDSPRGALLVWSGRHPDSSRNAIYAAFLPCAS